MATRTNQRPMGRINVRYEAQVNGVTEEIDMPLRILTLGRYTGREDTTEVGRRRTYSVDKSNFDATMEDLNPTLAVHVDDKLSGESGKKLPVELSFNRLRDFTPDGLVEQVPELRKLLEIRNALASLRHPLCSDRGSIRSRLMEMLDDAEAAARLREHYGITSSSQDA